MAEPIGIEVVIDDARARMLYDRLGADLATKELARISFGAAQLAAGALREKITELLDKDPTGHLARTVRVEFVTKAKDAVELAARPNAPYAEVQNEGGVIEAGDHLLAVPWDIVPRGKGPRDYAPGFLKLVPRPGKPSLLVENRPRLPGEKIPTPYFTLKGAVRIEGVHYVEAADEASAEPIANYIDEQITEVLERAVLASGPTKG